MRFSLLSPDRKRTASTIALWYGGSCRKLSATRPLFQVSTMMMLTDGRGAGANSRLRVAPFFFLYVWFIMTLHLAHLLVKEPPVPDGLDCTAKGDAMSIVRVSNRTAQFDFVQENCPLERPEIYTETLWLYCALKVSLETHPSVVDLHSNHLVSSLTASNVAVLGDLPGTAFLLKVSQSQKQVVDELLQFLRNASTPPSRTLVARKAYSLVSTEEKKWSLLPMSCSGCEKAEENCCTVWNGPEVVALSSPLPDELDKMATIQVQTNVRPDNHPDTPNFYEIIDKSKSLPSLECLTCLRDDTQSSHCDRCGHVCSSYCGQLCTANVLPKFVGEEWTIFPPLFRGDRRIPRIVHQTWFEALTPEKEPTRSRLARSFELSGWSYRFYNDSDIHQFLKDYFPPSVLEAYDGLIPGAFKADLFRYCVLLVHGGLYADVDVLLETNLDAAVAPDVGFVAPMDEPGTTLGERMCLWNGFLAAEPGHPALAKAVETIVNQVRNRFTSVDVAASFCPGPELSILHRYDFLFTTGPCLLGASLNRALGRHPQTSFVPGIIPSDKVGRSLILHQNKTDLGAHRFLNRDEKRIVAATDLIEQKEVPKKHYSRTMVDGIYGVNHVYSTPTITQEVIRIDIAST